MSLSGNPPMESVQSLIEDVGPEGPLSTSTVLRPERHARLLHSHDPGAVSLEIELVCEIWGGSGHPFVPVIDGKILNPYFDLLEREQIDFVTEAGTVQLPRRMEVRSGLDYPALVIAASLPKRDWGVVLESPRLSPDDPWKLIYEVVLGSLPAHRSDELMEWAGARDLEFDEILPTEFPSVEGSLQDLVLRIRNRKSLSPRAFSNFGLASGIEPDTSVLRSNYGPLPQVNLVRRTAGPNVLVAVDRNNVQDLALLWNLRGAHGLHRAMPIGIPKEQLDGSSLRFLREPGNSVLFGFSGGQLHLVSASVPIGELNELAEDSGAVVVEPESLLTFGPPPGRHRTHVATWIGGKTRINPLSDSDEELLAVADSLRTSPALILDVKLESHPIPPDPTMRGDRFYGRFQAGSAQRGVSRIDGRKPLQVEWPTSMLALRAVAKTRGLIAAESEPGLAASTLIRAIGSIEAVSLMLHPGLIDLIYEMAEVSGMSWFKKRWNRTHRMLLEAGGDEETLNKAKLALGKDEPVVAPPGEGRAVRFGRFEQVLGNRAAAENWVQWAERRHMLVRGAEVECPYCKTESWLPTIALPPPVPCSGCGREIAQPYGPDSLSFSYRLGEPLRRVLETDSLGHVITLRWLAALFPSNLIVGVHPGIEFAPVSSPSAAIGEADVLLLLADGSMVPVEVKRRYAGFDERNRESMNKLSDALGAPWDVLAITQAARKIPKAPADQRDLPERPRVVLTNDQLLSQRVLWALGDDPFRWDPISEEQDQLRADDFVRRVRQDDLDAPWFRLEDLLLRDE